MDELGRAFHEFYKLGNSGFWCCIKLDFDYNYVVYATLTSSEIGKNNDEHEPKIYVRSCDIDTEKGMIEFLKKVVKEAKEYERIS